VQRSSGHRRRLSSHLTASLELARLLFTLLAEYHLASVDDMSSPINDAMEGASSASSSAGPSRRPSQTSQLSASSRSTSRKGKERASEAGHESLSDLSGHVDGADNTAAPTNGLLAAASIRETNVDGSQASGEEDADEDDEEDEDEDEDEEP
jgi:hypothetical protein